MNNNAEFGSGVSHLQNTSRANENSLQQQSAMWNDAVKATIGVPQSILQPLEPSSDGMSAQDAADRTFAGQYLGNTNGESSPSFMQEAEMKLEDSQ